MVIAKFDRVRVKDRGVSSAAPIQRVADHEVAIHCESFHATGHLQGWDPSHLRQGGFMKLNIHVTVSSLRICVWPTSLAPYSMKISVKSLQEHQVSGQKLG